VRDSDSRRPDVQLGKQQQQEEEQQGHRNGEQPHEPQTPPLTATGGNPPPPIHAALAARATTPAQGSRAQEVIAQGATAQDSYANWEQRLQQLLATTTPNLENRVTLSDVIFSAEFSRGKVQEQHSFASSKPYITPPGPQLRQYLPFCTSKASKLSITVRSQVPGRLFLDPHLISIS
jgi:hypothetical protein